ncbi:MAG: UDP-N-acetylmuramoyl-L-alanyl-D-glutamate--2,6-diaminopimelate ligase [Acidimicrobiia bacterium]
MGSSKSLAELAKAVQGSVIGISETRVHDITHDSRQAGPGTLFVAISGADRDGHDFVDQAARAGSEAVCVERRVSTDVNQLVVGNTREVLGKLAAEVHGHPSGTVDVIGVTGTNGKTTVTHYTESLLGLAGFRTGIIGTIATRIGDESLPSVRTTPEASDFQRLLARMRDAGVAKAAVEVSSHALDLHRVDGTRFAVAAFTNLSQDHLDFHGTMEDYRSAKARLFRDFEIGTAVFNVDDETGRDLAAGYSGEKLTVGRGGDFEAVAVESVPAGTEFRMVTPDGVFSSSAGVHGRFNVSNLMVAIAGSVAAGAPVGGLIEHLGDIGPVPGRFEIVSREGEPTVVVDYAHTPDGIAMAVATGREMASGKLIAVFGAGGDRDRAKRPLMGGAASAADVLVVTSDNPRSEDPERIIDDVMEGVTTGSTRQNDRRKAIAEAIGMAGPGDVVLILGKGHEASQEIAGEVLPFDDREIARESLNLLWKSTNNRSDSGSMGP